MYNMMNVEVVAMWFAHYNKMDSQSNKNPNFNVLLLWNANSYIYTTTFSSLSGFYGMKGCLVRFVDFIALGWDTRLLPLQQYIWKGSKSQPVFYD